MTDQKRRHAFVHFLPVLAFSLLIAAISTGVCFFLSNGMTDEETPTIQSYQQLAIYGAGHSGTRLDVPALSQDDYPTGCESVSAAMLLQYYGFEITPEAFIDGYLPQGESPLTNDSFIGADPTLAFVGSPYSELGFGCYAPVITQALCGYLEGSGLTATELTGLSLDTLCESYLDAGIPVLLWATIDMQPASVSTQWQTPEGKTVVWHSPEHCVVLTGYDADFYYCNDPLRGKDTAYKKSRLEQAYEALFSQAVALS